MCTAFLLNLTESVAWQLRVVRMNQISEWVSGLAVEGCEDARDLNGSVAWQLRIVRMNQRSEWVSGLAVEGCEDEPET